MSTMIDLTKSKQQIRQQIQEVAQAARSVGCKFEYNKTADYISITMDNGDQYFFDEWKACQLIEEYQPIAYDFDVSLEDCVLYSAQSW